MLNPSLRFCILYLYLYLHSFSSCRDKKFADVLQVFGRMKARDVQIDEVAFSCVLRAIYHCRPWEDTISLLEESFESLGSLCLPVFHTALTNLNYGETAESGVNMARTRYDQLIEWLAEKHITPTPQTFVSSAE